MTDILQTPTQRPPVPGSPPEQNTPRSRPGTPLLRRRVGGATPADAGLAIGCALSSFFLVWLVFGRLTGGVGWFGFVLAWWISFVAMIYATVREQSGPGAASDRVATIVIATGAVVLLVPMLLLVGYVINRGRHGLTAGFFVRDQRGITPGKPATAGGGAHAIIGTLEQVGLALVFTVPLALLTAVFLNETRSRLRRPVRIFVDAMSGLPSIVAGLFIYAAIIVPLAKRGDLFKYNGFLASLALGLIMLPTVTRTVEVVLRLVPDGLREAALALGASRARVVWSVVLPTARTGVTTAIVLGIARAVGETAPLLFTSFGYSLMNRNPFSGAQESLPLFVYRNVQQPSQAAIDRAFTGAMVLLLVVLGLFALARFLGRDRTQKRTRARRPRPIVETP